MHCKELAHVILQVDKSQDLQGRSVSWRLRRPDGVDLVWVWRPGTKEEVVHFQFEDWQARDPRRAHALVRVQSQEKTLMSQFQRQSGRKNSHFW